MRAIDLLTYSNQFKITETVNDDNGIPKQTVTYTDYIYCNDSILHASVIMAELFEKALRETGRTVNMYCGNFSLFRDETRNKIKNAKLEFDTEGLKNDGREKEWCDFDPFNNLQAKINEFLNDNGHLNLIIERGLDSLRTCSVWPVLKRGMDTKQVRLYVLRENMGLGHFAATQEAYRIESSDDNKTATGCFNDKLNADILNDNFRFLLGLSDYVPA